MRLGAIAGNLLERWMLSLGLVPTPVLDTMVALLLSRTVMAGTRLGIFEALEDGPLSAPQVADRCATDPQATEKLLFALAGAGYLRAGHGAYRLAPMARKWLLASSTRSMRDAVLQRTMDMRFMDHTEMFVRTGEPVDMHRAMSAEEWEIYARGQRSFAIYAAPEVASRTPVPRGARSMLDIGGSHGFFSVALCRKHPRLRSTILDLPEAVAASAPLLAAEGLGDRVRLRAGNALTDDLGENEYDLVFLANLVHHFDEAANAELAVRSARALRPGGHHVIADLIRSPSPQQAGQIGAITDLFFAVTSQSGTWSFDEMARWQSCAGLVPCRPVRLVTAPGYGIQAARKSFR